MRWIPVAVVLTMFGFGLPTVAGAANCEDVTQPGDPVEGHYITADGAVQVWQETNRVDGLQKQACTKDGRTHAADTRVATVPPGVGVPDIQRTCLDAVRATGLPLFPVACYFF